MQIVLINADFESKRDRERRLRILQALLEGEELKLAAETAGIAYGTAREHVAALRRLNGNISITGVVVLALAHGLITLPKWMQPDNRRCTASLNGGRSSGGGCSGE